MRTRSIKPGFFNNDILGDLPALTRLLFIGLWCMADRDGRLEDRPKRINKELLGYDDLAYEDVDAMLQQLHDAGFILRYKVQGKQYIQVINFSKHQNPHIKEKASEIPEPSLCDDTPEPEKAMEETDEYSASTIQAPCKSDTSTVQAPLVPGNLLPITGNQLPTPESVCTRNNAEAKKQRSPTTKPKPVSSAAISPALGGFDAFWVAYPKKRAKANAMTAWKKIHPDAALVDKIMQAIEQQKQLSDWRKENGQYIPYPATWLNGEYWNDEVKEITNGTDRINNRANIQTTTDACRIGLAGNGFTLAGDIETDAGT